ncbi:transcriptional regulator, MarR family [Bradyrhizobium lablabi]|uniref:Transcriptional regulator, MarR family n=1 Tax=Bradyrhizobium lablabi TaxID=722472 RepID=A0A1M6N0V7_9BRAD|nr:MarR family transcriptional regulator [Bradyrhizobium lablabi]SHJ89256.1 transcriptional regulator, MarR family [Bradyrhizobium lablabi]
MLTKPPKSAVLTELVLEIFRLNGLLIASGDALVGPIGLTSARWQVLGAVALLQGRAPVAHIANNMGLTRQSVQRIADELAKAGIVEFQPNPHHKRAKLVTLTQKGRALFEAAMRLQKPWASALAAGIDGAALQTTAAVLAQLRARLEQTG